MIRSARPTDPLFQFQWYLQNTPTAQPGAPMDLDLPRAWADYLGRGVNIGVIEINPVQLGHPDLPAGFPRFSMAEGGAPDPSAAGPHPTAVAGIALGRWNGVGIAGIAPQAGLGSYTISGAEAAGAIQAALANGMHILNNSWGGDGRGFINNPGDASNANIQALQLAATTGRDGLGAVIVWAGGNERGIGSDSALDGLPGSRFSIAVAALERDGSVAPYSSPGANLLVSAFGGPTGQFRHDIPSGRIATTDLTDRDGYNTNSSTDGGDYSLAFDGTSAATPMVSGVAALMLEANPLLGYRQVHEILAMTARIPDIASNAYTPTGNMTWNGGSSLYSRDTGFGLPDAHAAVRVAEAMRAVRTEALSEFNIARLDVQGVMQSGPGQPPGRTFTFDVPRFNVERVEVQIAGQFRALPETSLTLSANNTGSVRLLDNPTALASVGYTGAGVTNTPWPAEGFTLQTPAFWGHSGGGRWSLATSAPDGFVEMTDVTLRLWGRPDDAGLTHHFTDDITAVARRDSRDIFVFPDSTREVTFNGAGLSGALELTFIRADGGFTQQRVNGVTIQTSPGENWRNAWGGDGDDRFTGNAADNTFYGGRGNNMISGGDGIDTAAFLGGRAGHNVFQTQAGQAVLHRDGRDALDGIERLRFEEASLAAGDATDAALVAASLYRALLGRAPDRAGFDFWQARLNEAVGRDAMGIADATQGFLGSAEFAALHGGSSHAQFVALLYQGFFGRAGDPGGAAHWEAALAAGATRAEVVRGFVLADEFQAVTMARMAVEASGWPL